MQGPTERSGICLDRERRRKFGGIGRELVDRRGRLGTNDIGGIERVIGIRLTFTGEGMEGDRLVSDVVHRKRRKGENGGGLGERTVEQRGSDGGYITRGETHGLPLTIIYFIFYF
jgi:hypothetical protein